MLKDTPKRALAATPKGAGRQSLFSGNIKFYDLPTKQNIEEVFTMKSING